MRRLFLVAALAMAWGGAAYGQSTYFGMTIPTTHPRLWYNGASDPRYIEAAARASSITLNGDPYYAGEYQDYALKGMLQGNASYCTTAANWAMAEAQAHGPGGGGADMDYARWDGQFVIFIWDWCNGQFTGAARTTFISNMNSWLDFQQTSGCTLDTMVQGNYFWGALRNHLMWGLASYEENTTKAQQFIAAAITQRYRNDFLPFDKNLNQGGLAIEGSEYGPYLAGYATPAFDAAAVFGIPGIWDEANFWKEHVYGTIYMTLPTTWASNPGGWYFFPHSDVGGAFANGSGINRDMSGPIDPNRGTNYGIFMTYAARQWNASPIGQHAAQWLKQTGQPREGWMSLYDPGTLTTASFSTLPLDYYAAGQKWLFAKDSWASGATAVFLQGGDRAMQFSCGHGHVDWGNWQMWRNGRWLSRETTDYNGFIPSFDPPLDGTTFEDTEHSVAHNVLWVQGQAELYGGYDYFDPRGTATTTRLESKPAYTFQATDFISLKTQNNGWSTPNAHMTGWVREFVFFRGLGTLVIMDRIQSDHTTDRKSVVIHTEGNPTVLSARPGLTYTTGTEAMDAWVWAVPSTSVTMRKVFEKEEREFYPGPPPPGAPTGRGHNPGHGQYRVEIDTTPGVTQSYIVQVIQGRAAAGSALSPTIVDNGASFTVTLDGSNAVTFVKGAASSGGTITATGTSSSLTSARQAFSVTAAGPSWDAEVPGTVATSATISAAATVTATLGARTPLSASLTASASFDPTMLVSTRATGACGVPLGH
jgi:hypothetical protein